MKSNEDSIIQQRITQSIYIIRDQKVLMDSDLAELYGVETKRLNEQVKRNIERFPEDFMFQLTQKEWEELLTLLGDAPEESSLRSQFATLEKGRGKHRKFLPYVFTEQGVAMLSSVLNSPTAIQVNISIMRVFVSMRTWAMNYDDLLDRINKLNANQTAHNEQIQHIYRVIEELLRPSLSNRRLIGFNRDDP
ncbi:MAG: ORF6N domain-containing protein [Flavobacteriales bacterium]|jgi:predicted XRE-type DNA-binding protein